MDPLPKKNQQVSDDQTTTHTPVVSPGVSKETEPHITFVETPHEPEVNKDQELSKEVTDAGVTIRSTEVTIPQSIADMGVQVVDQGGTQPKDVTVSLPLTDEQIAQGLHQSITSSWRWLSEWCVRQLRIAHAAVRLIHGKIVRVKTAQ